MACLTHTQNNNEEYTCSKQVQVIQFEPSRIMKVYEKL